MPNIKVDFKYADVKEKDILEHADVVEDIHNELEEKSNDDKDFVGWLHL